MIEQDELIAALSIGSVDYIVIGGLAVAAHGYVRATKDLDIVPDPAPTNLERLAALLRDLDAVHYGTEDFDPSEFPFDPLDPRQLAEGGNFVLSTRYGRLDVMQWVPGIPGDRAYEHLTANAAHTSLGGHPVKVCSLPDLILMKRTAARDQDLLDLRALGVDDTQ